MITCIYKGKRINSLDLYESNEEYKKIKIASQNNELYCEECGSLVDFHGGRVKIFHFKHKKKEACFFTNHTESQVMMEIKRKFYEYLKNRYSQYEIIVNYKHSNGVRSHFYIPELNLIIHLQRGNSKLEDWENRIKEIKKEGFKIKWYFFSARTLSMEKATLLSEDSVFRRIEKEFDEINFKSQINIGGRSIPLELNKSYPLGEKGIFELEEDFKNYLIKNKKEIEINQAKEAAIATRIKQSVNIKVPTIKTKEKSGQIRRERPEEKKVKRFDEFITSLENQKILGKRSRQTYDNYVSYMSDGWDVVADRVKNIPQIEVKAFVIYFILSSTGYYCRQNGLYLLNPFNPLEVIEIPEIEKGNDILKGKIYNKGLEGYREMEFHINRKDAKIAEISSKEGKFKARFDKMTKDFYLIKLSV